MSIWFELSDAVPVDATLLVVPVFEANDVPAEAGVELDVAYLAVNGFEGKAGDVQLLPADDGTTVLALGMGARDTVAAEVLRKGGAAVARAARHHAHVAVTAFGATKAITADEAASAFAEGVALATYRFDRYKSDDKPSMPERVTVVGRKTRRLRAALDRVSVVAGAVALARDLVNEPAGSLSPEDLGSRAAEAAELVGLHVAVRDRDWIEDQRLGGLAGVAAGSSSPPVLIELSYEPRGEARGHVVLVGKGITFDSGGLSLKPSEAMSTMKCDMAGGAAVIAAMTALPALDVPLKVTALVPAAENMPGNGAVKPGDVLRMRNGKSVEVLNTDAEGRLLLADALALAAETAPDAIIDVATLTGAQIVALGRGIAAVMGTDDHLVEQLVHAGERTDEPLWRLPLPDSYREDLKSHVADVKNIGGQAGSVMAGLFLREFVEDVPWAHIDIAGPAWTDRDAHYNRPGATGFGVRALLELLSSFVPA